MEFKDDWRDRAEMGRPFVFDRVVVADRSAAMLAHNFARFQRTASTPFGLPGSVNWWMTVRNNAIQFTGLGPNTGGGTTSTPVITYISRQEWGRRMLIKEDHEKLVSELYKLRDLYGYEINVVAAENMSRREQLELAARTTVSKLAIQSYILVDRVLVDHDGCPREWFNISHLDEALPSVHSDRVFLPWGFCF